MNTNTSTSTKPATATATSVPASDGGSAVGNKFKGVVEVVHGAGDALRGTVLGALDTITHKSQGEAKNDDIAQQGRLEMERGFAHLRSGSKNQNQEGSFAIGSATPKFYGDKLATTTGGGGVPGDNLKEHPQAAYIPGAGGALAVHPQPQDQGAGAENLSTQPTAIHGSGVPNPNPNPVNVSAPQKVEDNAYPSHHRDDARSGLPINEHPVAIPQPNYQAQGQNQNVVSESKSEYDPSQAPYRNTTGPAAFSGADADAKVASNLKGSERVGMVPPPPPPGAVTNTYPPTGPVN